MIEYALVTGASGGIGKQISISLAKRKYNLILVSRSKDLLEKLASDLITEYKIHCLVFVADLSTEDGIKKLLEFIDQANLGINILVNNAGYGLWGRFQDISLGEQLNMMDLNMKALVTLTHQLIPNIEKSENPFILNISSTAAYQAIPSLALYAATKSFVLNFSRALRHELSGRISVTCISPGGTKTGFSTRARLEHMKKLEEKLSMDAEIVAEIAVKALLRKKAEVIPGKLNFMGAFLTRLFPKSFVEKTAASIYIEK